MKAKKVGFKRFPAGTKERAFELLDAGHTGKAVAKELGVSYPTIINWKRERASAAVDAEGAQAEPDEVRLLKLENEYLKKRMATDDEVERLRLEVEYLRNRLAVYEQ